MPSYHAPYDRGIEEEKGIGYGQSQMRFAFKFIHVSGDKQGVRSLSIGDCIDWMGSRWGLHLRKTEFQTYWFMLI